MENCIFCKIGRHEARSWMITETEHTVAILDIHPMNRWHTLVIPKAHFVDIYDMPTEILHEIMSTVKQVVSLYREKLGIDAVQIISSNGKAAQQDVLHAHFHIAPRHEGDGQDVKWRFYPEMVEDYHAMLKQLGTGEFIDTPQWDHIREVSTQ
jgi:histidine triad (HIT) family protein